MRQYKGYTWGGDHDPILDRMDDMIDKEGVKLSEASEMSGVSSTTLSNWRKRKTKRPQFTTIMAVTRSLGYDLQLVRSQRKVSASNNVKLVRNVAAKADVHEGTTRH